MKDQLSQEQTLMQDFDRRQTGSSPPERALKTEQEPGETDKSVVITRGQTVSLFLAAALGLTVGWSVATWWPCHYRTLTAVK